MNSCSCPDSRTEVIHGDFFSVFDSDGFFWVVSNQFSTVYSGPFTLADARQIMINCNEFANSINERTFFDE